MTREREISLESAFMAFYMNSICPHPSKTMFGCKGRRSRRKGLARLPGRRGIHIWSSFRVVEGYNGTFLVALTVLLTHQQLYNSAL